ncbi:hypothetical protein OJ997_00360 [Solirubrobacter phytolaccae]|uniref:Uncharacterized protein n=1 Tax=Solirubrobacter phytolaccae TaxID=1404360 RepID=A0A9X3S912_9ACTN|nr:hypothetical protein [Solirubrobacter phytolaccae]MDA0178730.1 hypothetical protein [Solirubrobacter phytolaccae]
MHARFAGLVVATALALPGTAAAQGDSPSEWGGGAGGHIALITQDQDDGIARLQVIGPDGARSASEPVTSGSAHPIVTVGPRGDVVVLWYDGDRQLWVRYRTAAGVLGAPELAATGVEWSEAGVQVALDAAGTATVVSLTPTSNLDADVRVRTRTESGVWSEPQTLPGGENVYAPALAVTPNGSAVLAWRQLSRRRNATEIVGSTRAPGAATFAPVSRLVGARHDPGEPSVAANDRGDAVVGWTESTKDSTFSVHARFRSPGKGFGPATKLNRTRDMAGPYVTALPNGRMVLGWTDHMRRRAEGRVRLASGKLGPVRKFTEDLEQNSELFPLAVGRGAIAWADRDPGVGTLRIARTTASGRILKGETITRVRGWTPGPAFAVGPQGAVAVAVIPRLPTDPFRWVRVP